MFQRLTSNGRIRVAQAAKPVDVILEEVWVDSTYPDALSFGEPYEFLPVVDLVPRDMDRDARAGPGQLMDERRVRNPLMDRARRAWPWIGMEASAGIAIPPRRRLDRELSQLHQSRVDVDSTLSKNFELDVGGHASESDLTE